MYNPGGLPEDVGAEYIELHNRSEAAVELQGYRLDKAVDFLFDGGRIPPGGHIVVASNISIFQARYPEVENVVGPWEGKLKNSGERIALFDGEGEQVDEVRFADEGDWATRSRGPDDRGHRGWVWLAAHDGEGKSLELINPFLTNNNGQNWGSSIDDGGTPGESNSIAANNIAPIIREVKHRPQIPRSDDPVTVTCELRDEAELSGLTVLLYWRKDGDGDFQSVPMDFDGGDTFSAAIPPQEDETVVEFYVEADDGANVRNWPAQVESGGNRCNALYQVNDNFEPLSSRAPGDQPVYYLIMTDDEKEEIEDIGQSSSRSESNAQMNVTFVSTESTSIKTIYGASVRNRGAGSREGPPNNYLVVFPSDHKWKGVSAMKFNCRYVHSQTSGSWLFQLMGVEVPDTIAVQLRINGENLAQSGGPLMYGSYAMVETLDSDFTAAHWPDDPRGNLYQVRDDEETGDEGDLRYEGEEADAYRNTYFKQTNSSEDDWSDLIALTDALNNLPAEGYLENISRHVNVDQWLTHLAVDSLLGNREGGLNDGKGDDYVLYRGIKDPRFRFVPHDLDTLLRGNPTKDIWGYTELDGLEKFLNHPDIIPLYYAKLLDLIERVYRPEIIQPVIARAVGGFVSSNALESLQDFVPERIANVLSQIPRSYSVTSNLPSTQEGYLRTNSGEVNFSGDFHAAAVRSVLVNGVSAAIDAKDGDWSLNVPEGGGDVLNPGLNRVVVEFYSGKFGSGIIKHIEYLDVWYNTGSVTEVSGTLSGGVAQGTLNIGVRDSYKPGVPILVKLDFRRADGSYATDVWDATAVLNAETPGVSITPNTVELRNGVGSALVSVGGGPGGESAVLLPLGSTWKYLDDGSDQGNAWRASGFDDSAWESGPAELGYGDDDEETELSYGDSRNNKHATTYFRTTFDVDDSSKVTGLELRLLYDDGAIVYLNGVEFFKTSNMESDMSYDEFTIDGDDTPDEDEVFRIPDLPSTLLRDGTNTLAVEIKQGDERSSDISFNLALIGQVAGSGADPGDFILSANANGQEVSKAIKSLAGVEVTEISGDLNGASSSWSGVLRLTGDVTVPKGHVLTIEPGTMIMLDGTVEPGSSTGIDLNVEGAINSLGTNSQPVTFTSSQPDAIWGQVLFDQCEGADFSFTNFHRAGHSPAGGHTDHGRVLRVLGSTVVFNDCNVTDNRGKIGETEAEGGIDSEIVLRRCHLARSVMGLETFDTGVLVEDTYITDMLGVFREDGVTDDNDAIYLHGAGDGQEITLRNLVIAYMDDDGIDTLDADVNVINVISRNCADKGASLFSEDVSITGGLFVNNDIGISAKDNARVSLDFVTVAGNQSIGIQAENKDGNDAPSFYAIENSIIWGNENEIRTDFEDGDITVSYSILGEEWEGEANIFADPLFVGPGSGNFKLREQSPAIEAGNPGKGSPDLGYYLYQPSEGAEVRWVASSGPYHVIDDVTIPEGTALVIEPGTSVYFDEDKKITINGISRIVGTPTRRIQFSPVPGVSFVPDSAGNGSLPDAPPKSEGIKIIDSMDPNNRIAHIDIGHAQDREGAIGVIRSQCVIDDVRFYGTKIRILYTSDASIILENCRFPDVFAPDEKADELGLDNISEQVKGEGEIPEGGRYIIRNNTFGVTKGHNDVVDVDSGRRPGPIVQIIGNTFTNTGDEHIDLGGDVYVAGNLFRNVFKDDETSDRGYANAISTGDAGNGTTIVVARNVFWDVDHCINLKIDTATVFESNTVYKIHPDFNDRFDNPSVASVVNLFIPTDTDEDATHGDAAYVAGNILMDIPRVFSGADDSREEPFPTTPLEFADNLVDPDISDISIGRNHEGQTIYDLGVRNENDIAQFVDQEGGDFSLAPGSPGTMSHPLGHDLGAMIPEGIFINGEPPAITSSTEASLIVGGPGIWSYRWRINGGEWSAELPIGNGFDPPNKTVRIAGIELSDLDDGTYYVEVEGKTFAGEWQNVPTRSRTWTVDRFLPGRVVINEVLTVNNASYEHEGTYPDVIELYNPGTEDYDLSGHWVSDDPDNPSKFVFPAGSVIPAGEFLVIYADANPTSGIHLGFTLDRSGEDLAIYRDGSVIDSISFGAQASDLSIGRDVNTGKWQLNKPSIGQVNESQLTGNSSRVMISEWFANGQVALDREFIEIYNPEDLPVDISGMLLTDSPNTALRRHVISPLTFVEANGYAVISGLDFNLSSTMDLLGLFSADGDSIDSVIYGVQSEDYSQVRDVEGGGTISFQRVPTPGAPIPGELLNERLVLLLDNLRINELMFNPLGGSEYEYVELINTGEVPIDLTGVRFTEGIRFVFPEIVLAPGDQVLVVASLADFVQRYGNELNVAGQYSGKLDNGGESLVLALPEPYDVAIMRFSYHDDWFAEADGSGASLEVVSPAIEASDYQGRRAWQKGEYLGSPDGHLISESFAQWALREGLGIAVDEDVDGDGLGNLLEYLFNTDPRIPGKLPSPRIINSNEASGIIFWEVNSDIRKNPVGVVIEVSPDLTSWQELPSETIVGATSLTYRMKLPLSFRAQFIRLRARLDD
ncbi:MAG: lamin tail domain-containing protein [Verrucomicrobiales bacterium]|nr:lamin tail domain-containing protein [Verrucomicrobiales bacterium]